MRTGPILALLVLGCLAGCANAPEKARSDLRNDTDRTRAEDQDARRKTLRAMLTGEGDAPREGDPHLRAEAARGLGQFGNAEDSELLLELLLGPLADESTAVRLECAISLGKLEYPSRRDARRVDVLLSLRNRVAFDRDETGRPQETEFLVRSAMLNTIILLGGRDAAIAVHDVAERVFSDLENVEASLYTSATDRGLLDRCFQGLAELTGVGQNTAARNRFETDDLAKHLQWWTRQIAEMPEG